MTVLSIRIKYPKNLSLSILTCALEDSQEVEEFEPYEVTSQDVHSVNEIRPLISLVLHLHKVVADYHDDEGWQQHVKEVPHGSEVI